MSESRGTPGTTRPALPAADKLLREAEKLAPLIEAALAEARQNKRKGAISMARAALAWRALDQALSGVRKRWDAAFEEFDQLLLPEAFEMEQVPSVKLEEGFRVGVGDRMYVSVKGGRRSEAMEWLRKHAEAAQTKDGGSLADLITETINASTLSAAGRFLLREEGVEFPPDLFETTFRPTTTIAKA